MTEVTIGNRKVVLFEADSPRAILVQTLGRHEVKAFAEEVRMIQAEADVPFVMAGFDIADWDRELTPWHDPEVSRRKSVGDGADETLRYVCDMLLPVLQERYGRLPVVLGGYSLGGLFSLWASSQTDCFAAIAACSPSLWIRDWLPFAEAHPTQAKAVYLSLGDREELAKNKAISRVGDCVRGEYRLLQEQIGNDRCTLQWNEGNHFVHGAERTAKGFAWCLGKIERLRK